MSSTTFVISSRRAIAAVCFATLLLLGPVSSARAAVTVQSTAKTSANSVATATIAAFNPGGASNRVLVVGLTFGQGAPTGVAVKYGGVGLTLAAGTSATSGNAHTEIWYLADPSNTPADIVATWTGSHDVVVGAVAFDGADQTTPVVNGISVNGATTAVSVTITSAAGDMTMNTVGSLSVTPPFLSAPTKTQQWLDTTPTTVKGGGSTAAGAATVTHAWTAGSAVAWTSSGVDIKAAVIGYEVGTFVKTTAAATVTQVIPHGLGQTPKAVILWTQSRGDETFSTRPAITFRAAASAGAATGVLTLTINKPAGTAQNDVMVASIAVRPNTATITPPAGWTLIRRTNQAATTANSMATYYRAAGAAEPASYAWTLSASTGSAGGILSFDGVNTSTPVDVENGQVTASALTHAAPSVTTTIANDMVVTAHTMTSLVTWTPPAGMTEAVDVSSDVPPGNGQSVEMNYVAQAAIAATGAKTATASSDADAGNTETVTLRPAPVFEADFAFGFSDGTTDGSGSSASQNGVGTSNVARRMANKVITIVGASQTLLAEADLQSWTATSFTLNWTTNDADPAIIHYLLVGGSDVSAKVVRWQMATATGNHAVTGVGFQPTAVIHLHTGSGFTATPPANAANSGFGLGVMDFGGAQWATEMFAADAATAGDTQRAQTTAAAIYTIDNGLGVTKKASFVSMDADGFTVDFTTANANAAQVYSLALKGVNVKAGNFLKSTAAAPVNQSVIGTGFAPSAVFFHSFQDVTQAAPVANSRMSYGASDGVTEGSSSFSDLDKADPTNFQAIDKTSKAFMKVNNSTAVVDAEADLTSLDPDGFTVRWTTNDAVATEILYLGLANLENTEVRLVSIDAARYPRGVLVQWRTGYEIDNLGFNVYREINGVRTRVNTTLIAGSGLQAGQGGVVTAEHAYARWDLDPAAADATVTYWLDDVEFNGRTTSHGPVTPAVGDLQETPADSAELGDIGNAADSRRIFFNDSDDPVQPGARAVAPHVAPEVTRQWALAAEATVKVGVRKPGWYRVTQPELVTAGLDASIDPRALKLFVDGAEQAIRVTGETDGVFDAADAIEFYASGLETPYTDARVYWVEAGGPAGRRIAAGVRGASVPSTATGFSSTLRRKDRSVYFAALKNGDAENWFGPPVVPVPAGPDDPPETALTLTPHHLDRTAAGTAELTVTLQGVTSFADGSAGHRVGVLVNGTDVGEMRFAAEAHAEETFAVPVEALIDGENSVTVVARGGGGDSSLVDTLRLDYPHTYQADADRLKFTVAAPGSITVGGFAGSSIRVFDITDRTAPVELPATIAIDAGLSSAAVDVPGTGTRTLLAFSDETVGSPAFIQPNHPSSWHAASQAHDYVVISHADFVTQAQSLAGLRAQQGHTPAIIDVDDVYDEFSFGEKTPQAIKDFLQWARQTWHQAPRFVVLLGDATIDPRDYAGLGPADFVPTKQVPMSAVSLETASDDWFVDFDDNGLPDVPIGRLSARTADQAAAIVAKIVSYEQGTAPSTKDVLLVAGESDGTSNFGQFSRALGALVPHDYAVHEVLSDGLTSDTVRQAVIDRVNEGQLIVNYAGHGSVNFWGSDGDLMTNADVTASWRNDARLPFVVAMNCLNGLFNQVWDEESLAETLQRAPQGGAVAVWASSSVTPPATQALVNQELFRLIFQGTYATVGEAIASAKRVVTNPDLRKSWIFFGDPAMRLNGTPQPAVRQTAWTPPPAPLNPPDSATPGARTITVAAHGDLQAAIDAAAAGDTIQLQAGATFVGNFVLPVKSGAAYVTIRSATPDGRLPRSAARIGPAQAPLLAMIRSPNARAALATQPGAHHYRLLFLEFGPNAKGAGDIIQLGDGSAAQYALAGVPHDLQIDRCYIHGDATFGQQRGISLNSATTSIANSYVADIKAVDVSAQAISGWNGPGPYSIVNNYLEAAGQNVLLGGADASIPGLAPADVTMRLNYLNKPWQWRSQHWVIRNLVELNNAARVFIDGNVFEENGNGAQEGAAVVLMPRVQDGTPPARVEHVQFTNNIVRHVPAAIDMLDPNGTATDIVVRNNLFADLSSASGGPGRFLLISGGLDITVDHNTVLQDGSAAVYAYGAPAIGFAFTNNILPDNGRAVAGDGSSAGNGTIDRYFPGAVWLNNVVAAAPASGYPGGNFYPASMAAVGFVDLAGGNYRLAATSAYRNAATDGSNPGYDADALTATVPPSVLMCSVVPSVVSPAGQPVAVAVSSPILVAGAAPAGIMCATPAGSMFPVGSTSVACATVDLLARVAWCPVTVTVLPSSAPGSGPGSSASAGPPLGGAAVPRAAAPMADRAAAPIAASVAVAATVPDQPILPTEGSFPSPDLRTSAVAPGADVVSAAYAPLTTEMFAMLGMSGAVRSDVPQPPSATPASELPWSEPAEPPTRTQGATRKGPTVNHVELTSDVASPRIAGTTITVTAKATGGVGPHQYQWSVFDGLTWSLPTAWTEIATFMWTPAAATADLGIKVGVRSTGNSDETPEAHGTIRFVIVDAMPPAPAPAPAAVKPPRAAHRPASPSADNHFRAPATIRPRYSHTIGADEPGA